MEGLGNGWRSKKIVGGAEWMEEQNMWSPGKRAVIAPRNFIYPPPCTSFPPCSTPCWPPGGGAGAAWSRGPGGGSQGADAAAGRLRTQRAGLGPRRLPESRAPASLQPRPARLPLRRRLLPCGKGEGELHLASPAWDAAPMGTDIGVSLHGMRSKCRCK